MYSSPGDDLTGSIHIMLLPWTCNLSCKHVAASFNVYQHRTMTNLGGIAGGQGYNQSQGEYGNRGGPQTGQSYGNQAYGQNTPVSGSGYQSAGQGNRGGPQTDQSLGQNTY